MRYAIPGFRAEDRGAVPTLIEMTAKRWKAWVVISYVLGWSGLGLVGWQIWGGVYRPLIDGQMFTYTGVDAFVGPAGIAGFALFAIALGISIYARFMAWWHHG